jgi:DNA-binding beta-propeller fold protein YncE
MRNYIVQTVVCVLTGMRHRAWALAALAIAVGAPAAYSQTAQFSYAVETLGGGFAYTARVAVDSSGNVYAAVTGQSAVYKMPSGCTSSSCVTTLGGGFEDPIGIAVDAVGNVYVVDGATWLVKQIPSAALPGTA